MLGLTTNFFGVSFVPRKFIGQGLPYPGFAIVVDGVAACRRGLRTAGDGTSSGSTFCLLARLDGDLGAVVGVFSGLGSGFGAVFRFRDLDGGGAGVALAAAAGAVADGVSAASLAEERVTLEDMRIWFLTQWRWRSREKEEGSYVWVYS